MVGWHYQLNGHGFEQTPGDSEGQGGKACCNSWCRKELDMTEATQQQQHMVSKVMLKILQARLQQNMNRELSDVQAGFR